MKNMYKRIVNYINNYDQCIFIIIVYFCFQCGAQPWQGLKEKEKEKEQPENSPNSEDHDDHDSSPTSDVETELFIGPPLARRTRRLPPPPN